MWLGHFGFGRACTGEPGYLGVGGKHRHRLERSGRNHPHGQAVDRPHYYF